MTSSMYPVRNGSAADNLIDRTSEVRQINFLLAILYGTLIILCSKTPQKIKKVRKIDFNLVVPNFFKNSTQLATKENNSMHTRLLSEYFFVQKLLIQGLVVFISI